MSREPALLPRPINAAVARQLRRTYTTITRRHLTWQTTWCQAEALELGRLFLRAYGRLPTLGECQSVYGLPATRRLRLLFGSVQAYLDTLTQEDEP